MIILTLSKQKFQYILNSQNFTIIKCVEKEYSEYRLAFALWCQIDCISGEGKRKVKVKSLSCVRLFATPWTAAHQAPPSMGFSRQEYWSGVPLPSPNS